MLLNWLNVLKISKSLSPHTFTAVRRKLENTGRNISIRTICFYYYFPIINLIFPFKIINLRGSPNLLTAEIAPRSPGAKNPRHQNSRPKIRRHHNLPAPEFPR